MARDNDANDRSDLREQREKKVHKIALAVFLHLKLFTQLFLKPSQIIVLLSLVLGTMLVTFGYPY